MARRSTRRNKTSKRAIKFTLFLAIIMMLLGGFIIATQRIQPEKQQITISIEHDALESLD